MATTNFVPFGRKKFTNFVWKLELVLSKFTSQHDGRSCTKQGHDPHTCSFMSSHMPVQRTVFNFFVY